MSETELLLWARGPALTVAAFVFVFGIALRILEMLALGRRKNLAPARGSAVAGGLHALFMRNLPAADTWKRSTFTIISGYIFHLGLFVTIFLFAPHILVFREVFGLSWPALPTPVVDATAAITMLAMLAVLVYRMQDPVQRFLSNFEDYFVWLVTILPLLTGYIAFHRFGSPTFLLALHLLSVELFLIVFPFTKLMHAVTLLFARWYNGAMSGYRGVSS